MKTVLNIKTDKLVKEQAQALAEYLGVPLSTVVNAYLHEFVRSGAFTLAREPQLKPAVLAKLEKHIAEARAGKHVSKGFSSKAQAEAWLAK